MEQLISTGRVLGGFGSGGFEQRTVCLSGGDVIALFTDGLTDVGRCREALLGVEGVADLLRECCGTALPAAQDPKVLTGHLIAGVTTFTQGRFRDEIALLVGCIADEASSGAAEAAELGQ